MTDHNNTDDLEPDDDWDDDDLFDDDEDDAELDCINCRGAGAMDGPGGEVICPECGGSGCS